MPAIPGSGLLLAPPTGYFLRQVDYFHQTTNTPHSPITIKPCARIHTESLFLTIRVGVGAPRTAVCVDRDASGSIPKQPLETKAEAIDLVVPLVSDLVSVVQHKRIDLAQ